MYKGGAKLCYPWRQRASSVTWLAVNSAGIFCLPSICISRFLSMQNSVPLFQLLNGLTKFSEDWHERSNTERHSTARTCIVGAATIGTFTEVFLWLFEISALMDSESDVTYRTDILDLLPSLRLRNTGLFRRTYPFLSSVGMSRLSCRKN